MSLHDEDEAAGAEEAARADAPRPELPKDLVEAVFRVIRCAHSAGMSLGEQQLDNILAQDKSTLQDAQESLYALLLWYVRTPAEPLRAETQGAKAYLRPLATAPQSPVLYWRVEASGLIEEPPMAVGERLNPDAPEDDYYTHWSAFPAPTFESAIRTLAPEPDWVKLVDDLIASYSAMHLAMKRGTADDLLGAAGRAVDSRAALLSALGVKL